ncbi:UbiA family prenyltransferase [Streptomyces sp. NPDC059499]|uniref:UbiA family prenyltransferase n=1 Tax=Streptomyces sp. NPDC059499 TaxID=3346852 RepID=UPI0036977FB9
MDTTDRPQMHESVTRPPHPLVGLALSCHPGPVVAVTALVVALSVSSGLGGTRCVLVGGAVLTGQLSVGWCNDAFDARRDAAAGRRGKPVAEGVVSRSSVWQAAFTALLLCAVLSAACGPVAGAVHLTGVVAAWTYNLKLKTTALSWLPYVIGFGGLPVLVALNMPGHPWPAWWAVTAGALLGVGAHLGDVLPDIDGDLAAGSRGLPQRLGAARTRMLLPVPLVAASAVLVLGPAGPPGWWGALTLAAVVPTAFAGFVPRRTWRKAALAGAVAAASVDVALLLMRGTSIA